MIPIFRYNEEEGQKLTENLLNRSQLSYGNVQQTVDTIIEKVKKHKDAALLLYTAEFDKVSLQAKHLKVTEEEIQKAYEKVDPELVGVIQRAAERIRSFHQKQKQNSWMDTDERGAILGQIIRPLESVGVYVPGGKAAYPSSVLMNVIPAQVAGVAHIVMTTPPQSDGTIYPTTLVAAKEAGVTEIYKIGGAQAIAALAFGTETVPKVHKIVGPGNIYVALAKRSVYGHVSIDSVAGPSEILVLADETADPVYAAADLLSQAEHDELASSILITDSEDFGLRVKEEVIRQTALLSRREIIQKSLEDFGAIVVVDNMEEAVALTNEIAPEHLEVCTRAPFELLPKIKNAGAIFLGNYSPEPLGDYMAGPNHVLPTSGTAKFFSPLNIDDFMKKSSLISFTREALEPLYQDIITFAEAEELTAHANAVRVRYDRG